MNKTAPLQSLRWASSSLRPQVIRHKQSITCRAQSSPFSTSPTQFAKPGRPKKLDTRIGQIRYHLFHPLTPRPLRLSRLRSLRHWTIHRAWLILQAKQRRERQLDLERQFTSMRDACEALRLLGDHGVPEGENAGRLYRLAMDKSGVWGGVPIEYARSQTEWPARDGWNHEWKRPS